MRTSLSTEVVVAFVASASLLAADDGDVTQTAERGARVRVVAPAPQPVRGRRLDEAQRGDVTATYLATGEAFPRTYTLSGKAVEGTLVDVTDEVIVVETLDESRRIHVPRDALVDFEVRTAPSRRKRGALAGALLGVGVALAVAAITEEPDEFLGGFGIQFGAAAFLAVPSGAALGAIVSPGARWAPASPATPGVAFSSPPRLSFSVGVRF